MAMNLRTLLIGGASALFGLCVALAVVSHTSAQTPEKKITPNASLVLRLSLRLDESGEPKLYLDMPAREDVLRLLINGQEKQPAVFLAAAKGIPYGEVVKVIDTLGSLGLHKISLDTKH
jgi:biopolymer transport protein ExbD